jgi:hypothetical protein
MQVEGFLCDPQSEIRPGDTYLARRNTGWQLLTAAKVVAVGPDHTRGYIVPVEPNAYCYDTWECLKVVSA